MPKRERMLAILRAAEDALVVLASEAGAEREYVDAAALLEAARRVQQIGEDIRLGNITPAAGGVRSGRHAGPGEATKTAPSVHPPSSVRRSKRGEYPRFYREGETLVKVGWSKSEGSPYEHKAPKRVLDVLVAEINRIVGPGKRFVMDKVLPLRDPDTGTEFPTYQPYLALAFLRQAGLVEQHGRSGYSIPKSQSLAADADAAWTGVEAR